MSESSLEPESTNDPIKWTQTPLDDTDRFRESFQGAFEHQSIKRGIRIPPEAPEASKNRLTHSSFGDNGTTASVNAYGHIMQISRFLGHGRSGFYCVDLSFICEPYMVELRNRQLTDLSESPKEGMRLEILGSSEDPWDFAGVKPTLEFLYDRWPRYTFYRPKIAKLSVQYFCQSGTIFQRYRLKCRSTNPSIPQFHELKVNADILIRDLDFVNGSNQFNYEEPPNSEYSYRTGPHNRSIIVTHELPPATNSYTEESVQTEGSPDVQAGFHAAKSRKEPKFVGLVITAFAKGNAQAIEKVPFRRTFNIVLDEARLREFQSSGSLEITLAYRLQLMSEEEPWESSLVPAKHLHEMGKVFSSEAYESYNSMRRLRFSPHAHLDFITRRHLEHILSVCCIPITENFIWGNAAEDVGHGGSIAVALTCGDMSGHRLTSTTSFFGFQFLLSMFKYLQSLLEKPHPLQHSSTPDECACKPKSEELCRGCKTFKGYVQDLQDRVHDTCEEHLTWLFTKTGPSNELFSPHYWATGNSIEGWEENYYLSLRSLTDTPLQVIKAKDFYMTLRKTMPSAHEDNLRQRTRAWIGWMNEGDSRGKYMVPRLREYDNKKFHLADHARFYEALKAAEELFLDGELKPSQRNRRVPGDHIFKSYDSATFRANVVKRFITEHPVSKQRLLATSRTSSDTRFLFHSRDTALLYAMESGFFDVPQHEEEQRKKKKGDSWKRMVEAWRNTVEAQVNFEEHQSWDWENPLWYAFHLMASSKKWRISNLSAEESLAICSGTLRAISSPNGLFPGLVDDAKIPKPFEDELDRDGYWHVVFEIPHILWNYGRAHLEATSMAEKAHGSSTEGPERQLLEAARPSTEDPSTGALGPVKDGWRPRQFFKKNVPFSSFNKLIDQKGIVDIQDDWLLPEPESLEFGAEPYILEFRRPMNHKENATAGSREEDLGKDHEVIPEARKWYEEKGFSDDRNFKGAVIDVPGQNTDMEDGGGKIDLSNVNLLCNSELLEALGGIRNAQEAKKRLIWLRRGDRQTALLSYLASPLRERENVSSFFDRHASYEKYFFDSATASLNEWETEFHLSFFQLDNVIWNDASRIPRASFVSVAERNGKPTTVLRTVMSFRFIGDFFDCYWTCHYLEDNPRKSRRPVDVDGKTRLFKLDQNLFDEIRDGGKTKHPWQQRKVLELILMDEILDEMALSAKNILDWARGSVLQSAKSKESERQRKGIPDATALAGSPSHCSLDLEEPFNATASTPLNPLAETLQGSFQSLQQKGSDSYFSINERWRVFEQILQAVEEDLDENLEKVKEWRSRESDRGLERPRWTRNDERRYRPTINRLSVLTKRRIRDLERSKQNIEAFRETLTRRLTSIRDDISFRGSENINLFTYVTVVFLPLGFATGIFSMSEAPGRTTLIQMAITAIVSLVVTIGALINAKLLDKEAVEPAIKVIRYFSVPTLLFLIETSKRLFYPLLLFGRKFKVVSASESNEAQLGQNGSISSADGRATPPSLPQDERTGPTTPRELENGNGAS